MNRRCFSRSKVFILTLTLFLNAIFLLGGSELTTQGDLPEVVKIAGVNPENSTLLIARIPNSVKLNVVYIPQNDKKSCATTSIAMAISYYENLNDKPLDKETVWRISGTDEQTVYRYGNDMEGLTKIANYFGYKSEYIENMKIADIECFLSKGIPVMLNIRANTTDSPNHAVLVVGYNRNRELLYINDPANSQNRVLEYSGLEAQWSAYLSSPRGQSYQSGFIVYPKSNESGS